MQTASPLVASPVSSDVATTTASNSWLRLLRGTTVLFVAVHAVALFGAIWFWSWHGLALAIGVYFVRMFVVTAAYHRYFSHRAFKTSRWFQFVLALARERRPARRALVGRAITASTTSTPTSRATFTRPSCAGSGGRTSAGFSADDWAETDHDAASRDCRSYPELRFLNRPGIEIAADGAAGIGVSAHRRAARADLGLHRLDGAALARHVLHQLAGARDREAALRDHRRLPQQLAARAPHHG